MSILLIGSGGGLENAVSERLIAQGDEVRAVATDPALEDLATHGVHIARGPDVDADLVERAAQNVRTIVMFDTAREVTEAVIEGARAARVDRIVVCAHPIPEETRHLLRGSGLEYVVLQRVRKGLFRKGVPDEKVAEAVDAADDMAGTLRLELDLNEADAWRTLKLEVPSGA